MQGTLAVGLAVQIAAAAAFLVVGLQVWRHAQDRKPLRAFAGFWWAFAGAILADALLTGYVLAGIGSAFAAHVAMQARIFTTLTGCLLLVVYLLSIYRDRVPVLWLLAGYAGLFVLVEAVALDLNLVGVQEQHWRGWFLFENPVNTAGYYLAITLIFVPLLALALWYGRLFLVVEQPAQKYRVALLSSGLSLYFLTNYAGFLAFEAAWWELSLQVMSLVTAALVLLAVRPPAWARKRFGAQPFGAV